MDIFHTVSLKADNQKIIYRSGTTFAN